MNFYSSSFICYSDNQAIQIADTRHTVRISYGVSFSKDLRSELYTPFPGPLLIGYVSSGCWLLMT